MRALSSRSPEDETYASDTLVNMSAFGGYVWPRTSFQSMACKFRGFWGTRWQSLPGPKRRA